MNTWRIFVAGEPEPYSRRTGLGYDGKVHSRPAKGMKRWQELIDRVVQQSPPPESYTGPLRAAFSFVMPRTTTLPKTKPRSHTVTPDLDNCAKCVLDALKAWVPRDQAVVQMVLSKRYAAIGEAPGCEIELVPLAEGS